VSGSIGLPPVIRGIHVSFSIFGRTIFPSSPSPQDPHALGHAVEEAEIIEAKGLESDGGAVAEPDFLPRQIEPAAAIKARQRVVA